MFTGVCAQIFSDFLWVEKTSARLSLTQGCSSLVIACCCTIIVYAILKLNLQTYRITASENGYDGATLTTADMFTRPFLPVLREAVESMADGDNKYGLKLNLHAVISRTIRSLKGKFAEEMEDEKMRELDMFTEAYKFRASEMYATARYQAVVKSLEKARRPAALPQEADVAKLKLLVTSELRRLTSASHHLTAEDYLLLRSLVVCRLTLFNGRRGEEPARLLITEWTDAKKCTWLRMHEVRAITYFFNK